MQTAGGQPSYQRPNRSESYNNGILREVVRQVKVYGSLWKQEKSLFTIISQDCREME